MKEASEVTTSESPIASPQEAEQVAEICARVLQLDERETQFLAQNLKEKVEILRVEEEQRNAEFRAARGVPGYLELAALERFRSRGNTGAPPSENDCLKNFFLNFRLFEQFFTKLKI